MQASVLPSSFRDPSGFLFNSGGQVYRQVNTSYQVHYDLLFASGLYRSLVDKAWLVPHEEVSHPDTDADSDYYKILLPEQIPYISYPYEWCFSQIQDAAALTLKIQLEALRFGMTLKDASAYNIQFHEGRPVFIDTLSFEKYTEGEPWIAYRQFCQHFLAPLALAAKVDIRLLQLLKANIDGIPLDLASRLLPAKSRLSYALLAHIHLHARTQKQYEDSASSKQNSKVTISKLRMEGLVSSLQSAIQNLTWKQGGSEWGNYYADTNYVDTSMLHKEELVAQMLMLCEKSKQALAADFGANTGKFSRIAAAAGYFVLSHDIDEVAVEKNYRKTVQDGETSILPLFLDLTNPSPGLGWASLERSAFVERQRVDAGMALALIHHIAISNNVPLDSIASLFANMCKFLIIEFVPKRDSQVQRLLATRQDVFPDYNEAGFEQAFGRYFTLVQKNAVNDTERTLYLMRAIET